MLFINFTAEGAESFKSKYHEIAEQYKQQGVSFLVGDVESSQGAFQVCIKSKYLIFKYFQVFLCFILIFDIANGFSWQYFGLKEDQVPLIIIQHNDGKKFFKPNLELDQLPTWLKAYKVLAHFS